MLIVAPPLTQLVSAAPTKLFLFLKLQPTVTFGLSPNLPVPSSQDSDMGKAAILYSVDKSCVPSVSYNLKK